MKTSFTPNISFKRAVIQYEKDGESKKLHINDGEEVSVCSASYGFFIKDERSGQTIQANNAQCLNIDQNTQLHYTHNNSNQVPFQVKEVGRNGIINILSTTAKKQGFSQIEINKLMNGGKIYCFNNSDTKIQEIEAGSEANVKENATITATNNNGSIIAQNEANESIKIQVETNEINGLIQTLNNGNYIVQVGYQSGQIKAHNKTAINIYQLEQGSATAAAGSDSFVTVDRLAPDITNASNYSFTLNNGARAASDTKKI